MRSDLIQMPFIANQIGTLFEIADLGSRALPGFAEPQQAWRVLAESGVLSRFEALRGQVLTPFVGREEQSSGCCAGGSGQKPARVK